MKKHARIRVEGGLWSKFCTACYVTERSPRHVLQALLARATRAMETDPCYMGDWELHRETMADALSEAEDFAESVDLVLDSQEQLVYNGDNQGEGDS